MPTKQQKNQTNPATAVAAADEHQPEVVFDEPVQLSTASHVVDTDVNLSALAQELSAEASLVDAASLSPDNSRHIEVVQQQLINLKQDVLQHVSNIKHQLEHSQQSLVAFSQALKGEVGTVYADVSRLGHQLKNEVVEISHKHKIQLSQSLRRSKENTLQQWDKVKF